MSEHNLKPMSEVIDDLKDRNYDLEFRMEGDKLVAGGSKDRYTPEQISIVDEYRFEGESNPDDMSILYAIKTDKGEKGIVVNGYGVSANADLDEFLLKANTIKE